MEEIEAQRIVAEQKKQMQQNSTGSSSGEANIDNGLLIAPKVNLGESVEEQAVRKAQVSAICYFVMPITWIWRGQKGGGGYWNKVLCTPTICKNIFSIIPWTFTSWRVTQLLVSWVNGVANMIQSEILLSGKRL